MRITFAVYGSESMSNYITSAKILAVFLIFLSVISPIFLIENRNSNIKTFSEIIWGICGSLIHCLLFYGVHKKNKIALIIWIALACMELIVPTYFLVSISSFLHENSKDYQNVLSGEKIFDVVLLLANIIIQTLTIVIASKAKKKIEEEESGGIFIRLY